MNWTLEVVVVPVSDVDRAKDFYAGKLGFDVDHDMQVDEKTRLVQLVARGVEVSDVTKIAENPVPGQQELDNVGFVWFSDPDGNGWAVQQISARG